MHLSSLRLRNFRNHADSFISFCPQRNVFVGANAQGKTAILEAIYLLISGRSFRTNVLADMVRENAQSFSIEAHIVKDGVEHVLLISSDGKERRILYNGASCKTATSALGIIKGVIFVPEDQEIIRGGPSVRRRFLDIHIAQSDTLYVEHLIRYNRAMKQRNTLLRMQKIESIEAWEDAMAEAAEYIVMRRRQALDLLRTYSSEMEALLSGNGEVMSLAYKTSAPETCALKEYYRSQYRKNRPLEMLRGSSSFGPHRDDIIITIDGKDARAFASEGQQRCCVAALRLAEWYALREEARDLPLMAVDDIAISLDINRRNNFYALLESLGQIFLTSTEEPSSSCVATHSVENGNVFMTCPLAL